MAIFHAKSEACIRQVWHDCATQKLDLKSFVSFGMNPNVYMLQDRRIISETLAQLERQRAQVVQDIVGWGDFRRGSITSITGN